MSSSNSIVRALGLTAAITAVSMAGYAVYFDYQRRNSPEFRLKLKNKLKKEAKEIKLAEEKAKQEQLESLRNFLTEELIKDPVSMDPLRREEVFTTNVELGERLTISPGHELESAAKFYKALCVYPKPTDLLGIYQRTIPESIYEKIILMITVLPPSNITDFLSGGSESSNAMEPIISEIDTETEEIEIEMETEGDGNSKPQDEEKQKSDLEKEKKTQHGAEVNEKQESNDEVEAESAIN
ncbi:hypothetical protein NCAS_0A11390 [Naumovozyma castellii]|uniref:Mitochondrial import receptor subunit TOM20 n=1 Tax=Naumovozyma castellii TaxID=27288 RepID=G0V899_NAUCA|nr:hypothetical protein NCAS_0A11390 [Naumovozyma castellii CBS 4309]CCC67697.1 hypothetical protein NCAS_0A11390 [Naumovozyma castellii CBS 4309]